MCGVDCAAPETKTPTEYVGAKVVGGDEEDRTPDLRIANAALSQLSYVPKVNKYS